MLDAKIVVPTNEILQVYRKKVLLLQTIMKQIEVVAAIIHDEAGRIFATQRGYGDMKDQLDSVDWLPADLVVVEDIKKGE
ncbi:hypothetical protein SAMN04488493_11158 [Xylanibacter ruminicola]|nr:hypothetical protein SAMN04488493_11158 [Xylanibacter ruminicola]